MNYDIADTQEPPVFSGLKRDHSLHKFPSADFIAEELILNGFSIIPNFYTEQVAAKCREDINLLLGEEENQWGRETLTNINDHGVIRSPFIRSENIFKLCFSDKVLQICESIFGLQFILHVNRAVVNRPEEIHPATAWHREPPYQNFTTSTATALTFVHLIDGSSVKNGGLQLFPGSHKWDCFPSDEFTKRNAITPDIPPNSLLVFDSALFHRGSENSGKLRRSLVTIFSSPLYRQQIQIPKLLAKTDPAFLRNLDQRWEFIFGFNTQSFNSDDEYRQVKINLNHKIK